MEENKPKAWLPVDNFDSEEFKRYIECFSDLVATGANFRIKFYRWDGYEYQHSVEALVRQQRGANASVTIEIQPTNRYRKFAQVKELESRGYKRAHPTSFKWYREMPGQPSPTSVANYLLSGTKHLVDFRPNIGFVVSSEVNQVQELLDQVLSKHNVWGMPSTGALNFLNT
jgi:hypothetical protein